MNAIDKRHDGYEHAGSLSCKLMEPVANAGTNALS